MLATIRDLNLTTPITKEILRDSVECVWSDNRREPTTIQIEHVVVSIMNITSAAAYSSFLGVVRTSMSYFGSTVLTACF